LNLIAHPIEVYQNMKVAVKFNRPSELNTSVLFLVFNRPEQTLIVFESIRKARPPKLYIASDGPREHKDGDQEKVLKVREIVSKVDWPCEVFTLFREKNMGCKNAVSSAITWFFNNEEKGIILEDDCLPSLSFFWYCEFMLNRFLNDEQVFLISGDGRVSSKIKIESDIAYCKYPLIWGWASWSRVWKKYDVHIKNWPSIKNKIIEKHNKTYNKLFWENTFQLLYENKINTWDYQLAFLMQEYSAICIIPKYNLISNIGFGEDATHTFDKNSINANVLSNEIELPINLNFNKSDNNKINNYFDENEFYYPTRFFRVKKKLISIFCN
jgi:hypothetical protein